MWSGVKAALEPVFSDPAVVKIGHGISYDVRALHRDFGVAIVNAFDTHEAAKVLNLQRTGLAHVCEFYGLKEGEEVSSESQSTVLRFFLEYYLTPLVAVQGAQEEVPGMRLEKEASQ